MKNREILLVPGPTPVMDEIYDALSSETRGHTDPRFVETFKNAIEQTKKLLKPDGEVFIVAGSGTLAMEMAIVNTVGKGEKLLVISHGYFGDRFSPLAVAYGIEVDLLQAEWGKQVDVELVQQKLAKERFKAVTITHADTSTGVISNLEQLVPVIKQAGALIILDGVVATAALDENMSKTYGHPDYKIDVVLTGSQKAIGIPPGLAIVAFNKTALQARENLGTIPAYYSDIKNWLPIMNDPSKYFATPPVNMIYAYHEAMKLVLSEGIEKREKRHIAFGRGIRAALSTYGMEPLAHEEVAAPTLSCILYPEGVDDIAFRKQLANKGIIVAGALAHLSGKAFRIGHMGNTTEQMLLGAVKIIGESLIDLGYFVDVENAMDTFTKEIIAQTK
ncbi:serine-pyruvate aminotransferase [Ureibacillus massiliensis 4400831 = CIP 108448 = CCUG 49529]|uniref:Serine-pyruvate aminotransferase n=2 Tax=cellular organisms TaxID=131567 RepID=A0A0A3JRY0_9BACL|nr:alanine--glyoxylate aminotransferase family protein [Ureibacillus massiliensis]KGR89762.1 serine-pyruvate aminotransferase [Ureibacillus massiliensis 4400831 = CIP 108448 = CCUG 49529]